MKVGALPSCGGRRDRGGNGRPGGGAGDEQRVDLFVLDGVGKIVRVDLGDRDLGQRHAIMAEQQFEQTGRRLVAGHDADAFAGELRDFAELVAVAAIVARIAVVGVVAVIALGALGALGAFAAFGSLGALGSFGSLGAFAACGGRRARGRGGGASGGGGWRGNDQRHHVLPQDGDHRPVQRVVEIARQNRQVGLTLADRLGGFLRPAGRHDLQGQVMAAVGDLIGQRLHELCVQRTGGNPHVVRLGGEIETDPDEADNEQMFRGWRPARYGAGTS